MREELPARWTQPRNDVSVSEHGEHDPARRKPLQHVAGISNREIQERGAADPADAERADNEPAHDRSRHVRHHQHADPQPDGDAAAAFCCAS